MGFIEDRVVNKLKVFFKNLSSDNLDISLLKGEANLTNISLNEAVFQELLSLPPNLQIRQAFCNAVHVDIPYTNLSHQPIVMTMQRVDLVVAEPAHLVVGQSVLDESLKPGAKKKEEKRGMLDNAADGITVIIREVHVMAATLGPIKVEQANAFTPPALMIEVRNLKLQATNQDWQAVDLKKARVYNQTRTEVTVFKVVTAESINVSLASYDSRARQVLLRDVPIRIHLTTRKTVVGDKTLAVKMDFILDQIDLTLEQYQYASMMACISGFGNALGRVPLDPSMPLGQPDHAQVPTAAPQQHPPPLPRSRSTTVGQQQAQQSPQPHPPAPHDSGFHSPVGHPPLHPSPPGTQPGSPHPSSIPPSPPPRTRSATVDRGAAATLSPQQQQQQQQQPGVPPTAGPPQIDVQAAMENMRAKLKLGLLESEQQAMMDAFHENNLERTFFHFMIKRGSVKICDHEQAARTDQKGALPFAVLIFEGLETAFFPPVTDNDAAVRGSQRHLHFLNETKVFVRVATLSLTDLSQDPRKDARFSSIIMGLPHKKTGSKASLINVTITRREPRDPSRPVPFHYHANEMKIQVSGLHLVYDKDVIRRLLAFFASAPSAAAPVPPPQPVAGTAESTEGELPTMMFDNSTHLEVELNDPCIVLPPYGGHSGPPSISAQVWKLHFNRIMVVTAVADGSDPVTSPMRLAQFPSKAEDYTCSTGLRSGSARFEMQLTQLWMESMPTPDASPLLVFDPLDIPVSLVMQQTGKPRIEVVVTIDELSLRMAVEQFRYLVSIVDQRLLFDTPPKDDAARAAPPSEPPTLLLMLRARKGELSLQRHPLKTTSLEELRPETFTSLRFQELHLAIEMHENFMLAKVLINTLQLSQIDGKTPIPVVLPLPKNEHANVCVRVMQHKGDAYTLDHREHADFAAAVASTMATNLCSRALASVLQEKTIVGDAQAEVRVSGLHVNVLPEPLFGVKQFFEGQTGESTRDTNIDLHVSNCTASISDVPEKGQHPTIMQLDLPLLQVVRRGIGARENLNITIRDVLYRAATKSVRTAGPACTPMTFALSLEQCVNGSDTHFTISLDTGLKATLSPADMALISHFSEQVSKVVAALKASAQQQQAVLEGRVSIQDDDDGSELDIDTIGSDGDEIDGLLARIQQLEELLRVTEDDKLMLTKKVQTLEAMLLRPDSVPLNRPQLPRAASRMSNSP
eukprot:TRINITY_DN920_c0_g1_i1.p1 TRINITY_DN920_c0_g1~~TRINITY_DN920_c0_g1_i1.p1  ORF type:complete len:1199 (+),score=280.71 TRINITY_DN920_c0_g1_i1:1854-5450(+)